MAEPIRCFIAFDINNDKVLKKLSDAQRKLTDTGADLRCVKPENVHITLRFLGNIRQEVVDSVHSEMEKVSFVPFNVNIRGVGVFPTIKYARVVWAGIQEGAEELRQILNQLEPGLRRLGLKSDVRGFSPHITIARVRTGRNRKELLGCLEELGNYEFGVLRADCLKLKKSVLTPKGPIYSTLKRVCR